MELVVGVAVGVLMFIFVCTLLALIWVCRQRFCIQTPLDKEAATRILRYTKDRKLELRRVDGVVVATDEYDLEDVFQLGPNIGRLLGEQSWALEAGGPLVNCLALLKTCHLITDKLSEIALRKLHAEKSEVIEDVCQSTRGLTQRVDAMVQSMYPPLELLVVEARACALVMATHNLALLFRDVQSVGRAPWLQELLLQLDHQFAVLRESAFIAKCSTPPQSAEGAEQLCAECGAKTQASPSTPLLQPKSPPPVASGSQHCNGAVVRVNQSQAADSSQSASSSSNQSEPSEPAPPPTSLASLNTVQVNIEHSPSSSPPPL